MDYTVFVHVRDEAGATVSQGDGPPAQGLYPTSLWQPGEIIRDERRVLLDSLPPGRYDLVVGLYDLNSGVRLPVEGVPNQDIQLQSVTVPAR